MPSTTPLISIVIPTYEMKGQGVFFLERCLGSIQKQSAMDEGDIEILISDQSSNDAIERYCQTQAKSPLPFSLKYHRTPTGRGIAAHNLNQGIALAQGQYIKILFQDDLLVQDNYLKTILSLIEAQSPDAILTAATHTHDGMHFYNTIIPSLNPYFLFGNNTVSSPSVLTIAKTTLDRLPFDEHLKLLFDCDFYYRLFSRSTDIVICDLVSVANGVWEGQTQFAISPAQFTEEVRYLNWKYPNAKLTELLPEYQRFFAQLHPTAPFPFDQKISPNIGQAFWWQWQRQQIR